MRPHAWIFGRDAWRLGVAVLALELVQIATAAEGRTPMQDAVAAQLPKFKTEAETPKPAADEVKTRATLIRLPALTTLPADTSDKAEPKKNDTAKEEPVLLPQVTVTIKSNPPADSASKLPRLRVPTPAKDLPTVPFESPSARQKRLVEKHLSGFDRSFLNRFTLPLIGISKEARAEEMEARASYAAFMNDLADIEMSLPSRTPEEKSSSRKYTTT